VTPAEVLIAARNRIAEPERWTKGAYARDADGRRLSSSNHPSATCWCLLGALEAIDSYARERLDAAYIIEDILDDISSASIALWNDDPRRTHSEVLSLLDDAIEIAKSREE
jgi:hypothetical protein